MSIYTVDDSGQIIVTPPELDQFEYYRDNILVRRFQETIDFKYAEIESIYEHPLSTYAEQIFSTHASGGVCINVAGVWHIMGMVYDDPDYYLEYVTGTPGSWSAEHIYLTGYSSNMYISGILKDSSGYIHCFYGQYISSGLYYVYHYTNATGSWVRTHVDTYTATASWENHAALQDNSGNIHFFYSGMVDGVYYFKHIDNASGWRVENIESGFYARWCSAALKPNGNIVVAYSGSGAASYVAEGAWGSWSITQIATANLDLDVSIDPSGYAHVIAISKPDDYYLIDISDVLGSWVSTDLVYLGPYPTPYPRFPTSYIDENGYIHIFFTDVEIKKNWVYSNKNGAWEGAPHDAHSGGGSINSWCQGVYYNGSNTYIIYRNGGDAPNGCILGKVDY